MRDAGERTGVGAEDQRVDADDRIGADLGHDREQGGHRRRRRRIGGGSHQCSGTSAALMANTSEQQQRAGRSSASIAGRDLRHLARRGRPC